DQIKARTVTVGMRQQDGASFRYFNGYVNKFEPARHDGRLAYYNAEIVPWLWYLPLPEDCLIYQEKTVVEVIESTFQKYGFHDYDLKGVKERHGDWITTCQYQE